MWGLALYSYVENTLKRRIWAHLTNLTHSLFIEVPVVWCTKPRKWSCMCVLGVSLSLSKIFLLHLELFWLCSIFGVFIVFFYYVCVVRIVTRLICPILIYSDPDYIFYNEMTLVFLRNTYVYIPLIYIYHSDVCTVWRLHYVNSIINTFFGC